MDVWDMYFAAVCSIRFHPRNDDNCDVVNEVMFAKMVADKMMEVRDGRLGSSSRSGDECGGTVVSEQNAKGFVSGADGLPGKDVEYSRSEENGRFGGSGY